MTRPFREDLTLEAAHDVLLDLLPADYDDELSTPAASMLLAIHERWDETLGTEAANRHLIEVVRQAATTKSRLQEEAGDTYA